MRAVIEGTGVPFAIDGRAKRILWSAMLELGIIVPSGDVPITDADSLTTTFATEAPGLPEFKMQSAVGTWVSEPEIAAALVKARAADPHVDRVLMRCIDRDFAHAEQPTGDASTPDGPAALAEYKAHWDSWIEFLEHANRQGGFRVYGP